MNLEYDIENLEYDQQKKNVLSSLGALLHESFDEQKVENIVNELIKSEVIFTVGIDRALYQRIQRVATKLGYIDIEAMDLRRAIVLNNDFTIKITNEIGNDVTRDILEYNAVKTIIPFEKFFNLSGKRFIIDARGRFRENYKDIFLLVPETDPIIKNEQKVVYRTKIVFFNKKYDAEELTYVNIPFRQMFPIDFIGSKLLTSLEVKEFHHINKTTKGSLIYSRRRARLKQKWGFDPENLNVVIRHFLSAFESLIKRRFREFIVASSEDHNVQVTKMDLEFSRIQEGLPTVFLHPTICFDYSNRESNVINISFSLNKEVILKLVKKLWSKFKRPKPTAPKKPF